MKRRAFTLVELLVIVAVALLVTGFAVALVAKANANSALIACAKNLKAIAEAMAAYANENRGDYPRTTYDPDHADTPKSFTGITAQDPFGADGPEANDVTAAAFLLLRTESVSNTTFVCPGTNAKGDDLGGRDNTPLTRANFSSKDVLGYSFANSYPTKEAASRGYKLHVPLAPTFVVAGDLNPGGAALMQLAIDSTTTQMRQGNSANHGQRVENLLYGDGHVEVQNNPFVGVDRDNVYTYGESNKPKDATTTRPSGGAGIIGSPVGPEDSVLLPSAR